MPAEGVWDGGVKTRDMMKMNAGEGGCVVME